MRLRSAHTLKHVVRILLILFWIALEDARACSPWSDMSATWSVVGNELRINLNSHTGWQCCYTGRIELRCASQAFTGTHTHSTNQLCKGNGGSSFSTWTTNAMPYQQVIINLSAYCPGTQLKWRARESGPDGFGNYTPTYTFTVPGSLAPLIVNASANPASVCSGGCTMLSATSTGSCGTPTYSWSPGGAGASVSVCPTATTNYTVTVTDPGLLCPQVRTATSVVTVSTSPPPVAGTAAVSPASVCSGQPVNLSLSGHSGNIQWQSATNAGGPWTNIGGATGSTYTWPSLTATTFFRAQVSNACQTLTTNVVSVTVNPTPVAAFSATTVCQGTATIFTNASTIASGSISNYLWNFGSGGVTSNQASPSHTYTSAGTFTVSLTVTSATGCSNQITQQVTVNPIPIASFSASPGCVGQPIPFANSSSISSGSISTWQWNFGDGAGTSAQQSPSYAYLQSGSFNVTLTATSALGCSNLVTQSVTVRPVPVVAFSASPVCVGQATSFVNSTTISSGSVSTWLWDFGDGTATSAQQTPSHIYAQAGTYAVTLTATSDLGCTAQVTQQVTVSPRPVVQFSASPVCAGLSMAFTNTSSITSGSISTWQWDFGGQSTSALTTPSFTFSSPGTYNVSLTATSNLGCSNVLVVPVTVFPVPASQFTMSAVCEGIASVFTDQSSVGQPGQISAWQWDFGDGNTSAQQSPTHTFATDGTYAVTLTVTTADGCTHSSTQQATVYPTPVSSFTFSDVCVSSPAVFVNTSTVSSGSIAANDWDLGVGTSSAATPPAQTYPQAGTFDIILTVTTDNGCTHTSQQQITVHPDPVADFTFTEVCLNEATAFTDQSSIASGSIATWQWDLGDGDNATQPSPSHTYAADGTFTVTLSVESSLGCTDQVSQQVEVYSLPVASFTFADGCADVPVLFTNTSSSAANYVWDFGNGSTSVQQNPAGQNYTHGTYTVQLTAQTGSGCSNMVQQQVTVHPVPQASFAVTQQCEGTASVFTDNSTVTGAGQITGRDWDFGDGNASTQPSPSHTYAADGSYNATLTVTTDNGCTDAVTLPVTVFPVPVSQFTMSAVCEGIASVFTDQSSVGQPGQVNAWQWDFGDGNTSAQQSPTHTFATDGTYAVTLTVTTADGCTHSSTQQATVYPTPVSGFTFSDVCVSSAAVFVNTSTVSSGSIAANDWNLGVGTSSAATPPAQTYPQAGTFDIILTVTTDNGCTHTSQQQITVHPDPVADFSASAVCQGLETEFTDLSTGSSSYPINEWSWMMDGNSASSEQNPSFTYGTFGNHVAVLEVTNSAGCVSQISQNDILVHPAPIADFNFTSHFCQNDSVFFSDQSSVPTFINDSIISWTWAFDASGSASGQSAGVVFSQFGDHEVVLNVVTNNGCSSSDTQNVHINPIPIVAIGADQFEGCQVLPVQFWSESSIDPGYYLASWAWTFGDGTDTTFAQHPGHDFMGAEPGDNSTMYYDVSLTVTSANGCSATLTEPQLITVYSNPTALYEANFYYTDLSDPVFHFTDQSSDNVVEWYWEFGDGDYSDEESPSHLYADTGTYIVSLLVTTANGCTDFIRYTVVVHPVFTFYIPNSFTPNDDGINDFFFGQGTGYKEYNMMVYDRWGEEIFESHDDEFHWDGSYKTRPVHQGTYTYRFVIYDWKNHQHIYTNGVTLHR